MQEGSSTPSPPTRTPRSPCSDGGPEIKTCTPMEGRHGCRSIGVHEPAHFSPACCRLRSRVCICTGASSLWLSTFSRATLDPNSLPHGLKVGVRDGRVLEGNGEPGSSSDVWSPGEKGGRGCLVAGPGMGSNPDTLLSNYVYNIHN